MAFGEASTRRRQMTPADVREIFRDWQGCTAEDPNERADYGMPLDVPGLVGMVMGAMAAMFLGVVGLAVGRLLPPRRATMGRLRTFGDLCRAMVDQEAVAQGSGNGQRRMITRSGAHMVAQK